MRVNEKKLPRGHLNDRQQRKLMIVTMWIGIVLAGITFAFKIAEFIFTMSSPDAQGFADVPVTVYFCVAAGWLCMFFWAHRTGQLRNLEDAKFDILKIEEEHDRAGR